MKKRMLALILAALMILSSGCGRNQEIEEYRNRYQRVTQPPKQAAEIGTEEANIGEESQPQAYEQMQWVYKPDGQGSMVCTITGVRTVKNDRDFDGNCFTEDGYITLSNPEYTEERFQQDHEKYPRYLYLHYPDSVDENGDLLDGYLILVDLTVENIDATNQYLSHQTGKMTSLEDDIYIFRSTEFLYLINRAQKEYRTAVYYSDIWNLEEHPMKFRLGPGETASFQIGFLTNKGEDTWKLEDDLVLSTAGNIDIGILFPLDLEAPED